MSRKVLIISDLKESTESTLHTAAKVAKSLKTNLYFLSVQKPVELVGIDSQLTAIRNINYKQSKAITKIKSLIKPFQKDGVQVDFKHIIGNVKNEILAHIKVIQPEIIVLGKRKHRTINIVGDKLTDFILKHHKGNVILVQPSTQFPSKNPAKFGILNDDLTDDGKDLIRLMTNTDEETPIIKLNYAKKIAYSEKDQNYDEENNLIKEKYDMLCVNRKKHEKNLKKMIARVQCSLALTH